MLKWTLIAAAIAGALLLGAVVIGSLLPQEHVARREARFSRPAAEVYSAISDVARYPEWRADVRAVRLLDEEPLRWTEEGSHGTITFEVDEASPPARLVVRIADPDLPFGGRWIYDLEPWDAGTRVVITEEGKVYNPLFRFLSRFVFSQTATIETYLKHLGGRFGLHVTPAEPSR